MNCPGSEHHYRRILYEKYRSQKICIGDVKYSEKDYQRWADMIKVRVRDWLPSDRNTPILDMGCGPGNFLYLLDRLGYTDLTGVDLSPEQIVQSRQWCPRATIIQEDVRDVLAKNPGRFGLIAGFQFIEHFDKDELFHLLILVSRALFPGGRIILETPNAESPWGLMHRYHDLTHELAFDPHSLAHVLRTVGIVNFSARECGPFPHGLNSIIRFLVWRLIRVGLVIWNLAETGSLGSGVFTRVFIASAIKKDGPCD